MTGGAMGIGFGIARRLAQSGASVAIADVNGEVASTSAGKLSNMGLTAYAVAGDVGSANDVQRLPEATIARSGSSDVWVNNAGVYPMSPILEPWRWVVCL